MSIVTKIFGTHSDRELKRIMPLADKVRPKSFDEVAGQKHLLGKNAPLRRIVESGHLPSLVFHGPPGTGKSMLAKRVPSILPPLTFPEAVETTKIHSVAGMLGDGGLVTTRSEGRRAVEQGGVSVDGEKITDFRATFSKDAFADGKVVRRGKKTFKKITL